MLEATAIGNLTRDPELRSTSGGSMCNFSIGVRTVQKDAQGGYVSQFVQVTMFGKQAENASTYLKKGSKVAVTGGLSLKDYKTKEGQDRSAMQLIASNIEYLTARSEGEEKPAPAKRTPVAKPQAAASAPAGDDELPF